MSGEPDTMQKKLTENISTLPQTTCIVLQWIPAHTSIREYELADQLTKERREKEQHPTHLSYREVKTLIRNKKKAIFHCKTVGYNPNKDALHQLARHQQTTIFRLRTGHCRLNSRLKRIGVKTSAQCPCGEVDQTPEYYLQFCSLHQQARQQIWPSCAQKRALGCLQRICSWHPSVRHAWERRSSQRNHLIECRRSRTSEATESLTLCRTDKCLSYAANQNMMPLTWYKLQNEHRSAVQSDWWMALKSAHHFEKPCGNSAQAEVLLSWCHVQAGR